MADVKAVTRIEAILNGEDITPVTREEAILSGADVEPLSREEYFVQKRLAGGGGGFDTISVVNISTGTGYTDINFVAIGENDNVLGLVKKENMYLSQYDYDPIPGGSSITEEIYLLGSEVYFFNMNRTQPNSIQGDCEVEELEGSYRVRVFGNATITWNAHN